MRLFPILLSLLTLPLTFGQLNYRGELEFAADAAADVLSTPQAEQFGWTIAAHLEADYELDPLTFNLELDPSLRFSQEVSGEPGFTELYAATSFGDIELSAGRERLALEYARVTLPFAVEEINNRGVRLGVPGVRAVWYPENYRVRGALFYRNTLIPLVNVRRTFGTFELEATALYQDRFVAGLGGSGSVGDLVVYGEGWLLTDPFRARAAFGVTGYLGARLWTLEAAYAPLEPDALAPELSPAAFRAAGQITLLQDEDSNLDLDARVGFPETGVEFTPTLSYTALGEQELTATLRGRFSETVTVLSLNLGIRSFF